MRRAKSEGRRLTQADRVVKYIHEFGSITSLEAFRDLGITRLAAVVWTLTHKRGYQFVVVTEGARNRYGDPVYFARYSLKEH